MDKGECFSFCTPSFDQVLVRVKEEIGDDKYYNLFLNQLRSTFVYKYPSCGSLRYLNDDYVGGGDGDNVTVLDPIHKEFLKKLK